MKCLASVSLLLTLSACAIPPHDQPSDRYANVAPQRTAGSQSGLWTGTSGTRVVTLRIDDDGRGVSCSAQNGKDSDTTFKVANGTAYFADGRQMTLSYGEGYIDATPSGPSSQTIRLDRDTGLSSTSTYRRERLTKPYL